jgi:hypothetical protein
VPEERTFLVYEGVVVKCYKRKCYRFDSASSSFIVLEDVIEIYGVRNELIWGKFSDGSLMSMTAGYTMTARAFAEYEGQDYTSVAIYETSFSISRTSVYFDSSVAHYLEGDYKWVITKEYLYRFSADGGSYHAFGWSYGRNLQAGVEHASCPCFWPEQVICDSGYCQPWNGQCSA